VFSGASEKLVLYDSCSLGFLCYNYINLYLYRLVLRGISFSLHIQIKQAWRGQIVVRCKAVRAMEAIPGRTAVIYFRKRKDKTDRDRTRQTATSYSLVLRLQPIPYRSQGNVMSWLCAAMAANRVCKRGSLDVVLYCYFIGLLCRGTFDSMVV
jgi:hypothetical protein